QLPKEGATGSGGIPTSCRCDPRPAPLGPWGPLQVKVYARGDNTDHQGQQYKGQGGETDRLAIRAYQFAVVIEHPFDIRGPIDRIDDGVALLAFELVAHLIGGPMVEGAVAVLLIEAEFQILVETFRTVVGDVGFLDQQMFFLGHNSFHFSWTRSEICMIVPSLLDE